MLSLIKTLERKASACVIFCLTSRPKLKRYYIYYNKRIRTLKHQAERHQLMSGRWWESENLIYNDMPGTIAHWRRLFSQLRVLNQRQSPSLRITTLIGCSIRPEVLTVGQIEFGLPDVCSNKIKKSKEFRIWARQSINGIDFGLRWMFSEQHSQFPFLKDKYRLPPPRSRVFNRVAECTSWLVLVVVFVVHKKDKTLIRVLQNCVGVTFKLL